MENLYLFFGVIIVYCLYKFISDNYKTYKTVKFLSNEEDIRLVNAMIKYVNSTAGERLAEEVPTVESVEDFYKLDQFDKNIVSYTVDVLLEDKPTYVDFFKKRGDI